MKAWWFSLGQLLVYVLTFQLWLTFPGRTTFLAVGALAVLLMVVGFRQATRRRYFVDRTDLVLHALVIFDVALESVSYEVFHVASVCIFCTPGDPNCFHSNYNFCWCSAILGLLVGGHHAWALHRAHGTLDKEQVTAAGVGDRGNLPSGTADPSATSVPVVEPPVES